MCVIVVIKLFRYFPNPHLFHSMRSTYFQSLKIFYFYWLRFCAFEFIFIFHVFSSSFCTLFVMTQIEIPLLTTVQIWPELRFSKTMQFSIDLIKCNLMHRFNLSYGIIRIQRINDFFRFVLLSSNQKKPVSFLKILLQKQKCLVEMDQCWDEKKRAWIVNSLKQKEAYSICE